MPPTWCRSSACAALNSTIDDVDNLAWKLALVVGGQADATLLDSYATERVQAARENLAYGSKSTRVHGAT